MVAEEKKTKRKDKDEKTIQNKNRFEGNNAQAGDTVRIEKLEK